DLIDAASRFEGKCLRPNTRQRTPRSPSDDTDHSMTTSLSQARLWIRLGAVAAALAVVLGALAAHGLDGFLLKKYAGVTKVVAGQEVPGAVKYLGDFKTAATYQM